MMEVSDHGIQFVCQHEGCRLQAYLDTANPPVWTIGYGSTSDVDPGLIITVAEAQQRLKDDLQVAVNCINKMVTVPLTQNEFDALTSFVFNIGCLAFRKSTLLEKLNNSDYDGACAEFSKWTRAGDAHPAGLVKRRADEARLFDSA